MPDFPHHSDDAFMENATPVQSFVDPPHEVTEEERNRPRHGRPVRKPKNGQSEPMKGGGEKSATGPAT